MLFRIETWAPLAAIGVVTAWGDSSTRGSDLKWLLLFGVLYVVAALGVAWMRRSRSDTSIVR